MVVGGGDRNLVVVLGRLGIGRCWSWKLEEVVGGV